MGGTAAIIAAVAGTATAANSIVQGQKQAKVASRTADAQAAALADQQKKADDLAAQQAADESRAQQAADLQRRRIAAATGLSDTILTGPNGVLSQAPTQYKTLLGM